MRRPKLRALLQGVRLPERRIEVFLLPIAIVCNCAAYVSILALILTGYLAVAVLWAAFAAYVLVLCFGWMLALCLAYSCLVFGYWAPELSVGVSLLFRLTFVPLGTLGAVGFLAAFGELLDSFWLNRKGIRRDLRTACASAAQPFQIALGDIDERLDESRSDSATAIFIAWLTIQKALIYTGLILQAIASAIRALVRSVYPGQD